MRPEHAPVQPTGRDAARLHDLRRGQLPRLCPPINLGNVGCQNKHKQHGGMHGISKYYWPAKYAIEICDKFISNGWGKKNKKIAPLGNISLSNKLKRNNKSMLLIVFTTELRYANYLGSKPISAQALKNFKLTQGQIIN